MSADPDFMLHDGAIIDDRVVSNLRLRAYMGVIANETAFAKGGFFAEMRFGGLDGDELGGSDLVVDVKPLYIVADRKKVGKGERTGG